MDHAPILICAVSEAAHLRADANSPQINSDCLHLNRTVILTMISPSQIRGARAMLGLKQSELADLAGISKTGLINIEGDASDPKASTLSAIQRALETAGAEFIPENGGGAEVRLRKPRPDPPAVPVEDLNASNDE